MKEIWKTALSYLEKRLSFRMFTLSNKKEAYERYCVKYHKYKSKINTIKDKAYKNNEIEADYIIA